MCIRDSSLVVVALQNLISLTSKESQAYEELNLILSGTKVTTDSKALVKVFLKWAIAKKKKKPVLTRFILFFEMLHFAQKFHLSRYQMLEVNKSLSEHVGEAQDKIGREMHVIQTRLGIVPQIKQTLTYVMLSEGTIQTKLKEVKERQHLLYSYVVSMNKQSNPQLSNIEEFTLRYDLNEKLILKDYLD
eukprot:TRINITY_DN18140_c0_g1_i1.p1 TRINITY_DN18140_c0_g1~~TRINITY_DN18140_c0_g1_i1.p1  ORF type:complete len:189 (-),score=50.03 TRINITY_DN18140_c0_g1_i1:108-674(-)